MILQFSPIFRHILLIFSSGFNKDEASLFIFDVIANLTKESVEEDPYSAFVSSATFLGTTLRVNRQDLVQIYWINS